MADEFKKKRYKETGGYATPPYHNYYTNKQLRSRMKRELPRPCFEIEGRRPGQPLKYVGVVDDVD